MKKTLLYISSILIIYSMFFSNVSFAETETETLTSAGLSQTAEVLKEQSEKLIEIWDKQKAELAATEDPEGKKAIIDKYAKEIADLNAEYQKKLDNIPRDPNASEYTPSLTPKPSTLPGPTLSTGNLERNVLTTKTLPRVASFLIGFAGVSALIFMLYAGIQMMLSIGEEESYNKGKERIQWAIIGLLVSLVSYIAVQVTINLNLDEEKQNTTQTE